MTIRVIVVEDHPLILSAILNILEKQEGIQVVATSVHGSELLSLVSEHLPDIIFLDLWMPDFEPLAAVNIIRREQPDVRCIVLTADKDPYYIHAMSEAGVWGYIIKSDNLSLALPDAVLQVYGGKRFFSPEASSILLAQKSQTMDLSEREVQVLSLAASGYQNSRIAETLGISQNRVRHALSDVYMKFGIQENAAKANSRATAIAKAQQMGLL